MTDALTTRETADHAELARLAEAERDAATFLEASLMREALQKRLTAPVVLALLSEIAALRGERDTWKAMAENGAGGIIAHINRATQAERQRDEAVGLLREAASELESEVEARYDGIKDHPAMTPKYERDMDTPQRIRAFIANQGADPAPVKKERAWICPQDNAPCPPECDSDDRRHCASVACKEQPA